MTALDLAAAPPACAVASTDAPPSVSERFRLATLAREAALLVPGVVDTDSGPLGLFVSVGGGRRLEGVVCSATKSGGYDVSLRLTCRMVPLLPLGEQVRAAVQSAALAAGTQLERVTVHVGDIVGAV